MERPRILVIRLGAMGDLIHALPAAATLKHSFPHCHLSWVVEPKWAVLLQNNPFLDSIIPFDRRTLSGLWEAAKALYNQRFDFAVDFQGLIKSALTASVARPDRIIGFHQRQVREKPAALFYSHRVLVQSAHMVDRNLELAQAAGATSILHAFPLPKGVPEGDLPAGPFVLACPLAGWSAKQWPLEYYTVLAQLLQRNLKLTLVLNGPPAAAPLLSAIPGVFAHESGIPGLIHATRRAEAVFGIDSGPLHLAAALGKPGVAVFGPTDPGRNGPYGDSITVLRSPEAPTSYKRRSEIAEAMREITPDAVFESLKARISCRTKSAQTLA